VVLERDVFDAIAHVLGALLHVRKNKAYVTIKEKYHRISGI